MVVRAAGREQAEVGRGVNGKHSQTDTALGHGGGCSVG